MAIIRIETKIKAELEVCFKLSLSIDLHKISAEKTKEKVIDGRQNGLIKLNETVTWKAKHFGIWHKLKVKITEYEEPNMFIDEMLEGSFKLMKHKHLFEKEGDYTLMKDEFEFISPFGLLGRVVDKLILKPYLTKFLIDRNRVIMHYAESEKWKALII